MKKLLAVPVLALLLFNCKKNDTDPGPIQCTYDSCAVKAPASEIQQVQNYLTTNNITATQHCSGLFYSVEIPGNGDTANACSQITAKYVGKLTNGTIFDQTGPGPNDVLSVYLSNLIRGWINGIPYVRPGGRIHLYIPPALAYGASEKRDQNGNVVIPANSIIIFDVDLLSVK